MTCDVLKLRNQKCRLWKKYKLTQSNYDKIKYARAKNQLRNLTRQQRYSFESNIARDIKTAPKKFWAYVKSRTKTRSSIPSLKKNDGFWVKSSLKKAETLNNFFDSIFTREDLTNIPICKA